MSEKPEWFELTEGDQKPNFNKQKPSRNIFVRALAIGVPLLIVGSAMVFAEVDSKAEEITQSAATQTISDNTADAQTDINGSNSFDNTSGNENGDSLGHLGNAPKSSKVADPNSNTNSKKGLGVPAPSLNREDDDEHEGREHHEREGHESGEHRER